MVDVRDRPSVKTAASDLIARGFSVVPLQPNSKRCIDESNWLKIDFTPEEFREGDNIGIKQINGVVDIDVDSPEAVLAADAFLPLTTCIYGRASKPKSHRLYTCRELDKPVAHKELWHDTDGKARAATIIEIRVNHQSMCPPSVHESGEPVYWERTPLTPDVVEVEALKRAVQLTATAALVGKRYNPPGDRHDWGMALAGLLRQLELTVDEAKRVMQVAGDIARDEKIHDRLSAVSSTYAKPDDDPLKGARALEKSMHGGVDFIAALRKIWGVEAVGISKNRMEELNERHAVIFQQSGDLIIITEDRDADQRPFLRFSSPEVIRNLYPEPVTVGFTARGAPQTKALGQAWLTSPQRRFYNGIELAPNGRATPNYYNMWRGFSVQPKPGNWSRFKAHVEEVICDGKVEIARYVFAWMANAVQKPGRQAATAIALRGGQGTGKGSFVRGFGALFGVHFLHLDSTRHLTGNFNAHLHNAILVFADEAAWPGDKAGLGALKRLITEPTLSIERKGHDIFQVQNMIHLLLASNEDWTVPAAMDERRFVVLDIAQSRQNDTAYFAHIEDELHAGGLEAMLHDLMAYESDVDLRVIPQTKALYEQKRLTMSMQRKWWYQCLHDGDLWRTYMGNGKYWVDRDFAYGNYVTTLDRAAAHGRTPKGLETELGIFLKKVLPHPYPESRRGQNNGKRGWIFPDLATCRAFYAAEYRVNPDTLEWPAEDAAVEEPAELEGM